MPRIVTHNLPHRLTADERRDTVHRLAGMCDVLALQESAWLDDTFVPDGWRALRGMHDPLPILVPDRLEVTGQTDRRAYPPTRVGPWGAGPGVMTAGWDYGIRLQRDDGAQWWVLNAHLVPSTQRAEPTDPDDHAGWEKRRELYRLEVAQLAAMTDGLTEPCFVVGDFNATPAFKLLDPLRQRFRCTTWATHGGSAIDHIWHRGAELAETHEVTTPSDHDAVWARYRLRGSP